MLVKYQWNSAIFILRIYMIYLLVTSDFSGTFKQQKEKKWFLLFKFCDQNVFNDKHV